MAFQQLYYTSCEHGLGGYGGYQFNAITPGTPPVLLREVEERTVYEPPRSLLADPDPEDPEAYPVAFSYGMSEATGMAIVTHVVFTGTDYSGRPGNYFVHALATSAPERDFDPLLPAELWGAALWQTSPVGRTELPELLGPLPRGVIDRPGVQAFLDARGAESALPGLLTAAARAMTGERPVLVVSHDATENAWWIAAISYFLGEQMAYQMTFTTYSHRPGYSRYHLTGALPDTLPPDAGTSFQLFDFTAGRTPGRDVHPVAVLLASAGVMASRGLWQQAAAFASGTEKDLDDWLGPVAVAAGLLGRPLSPDVADAVARWLPVAAGPMPPQLTEVALGVVLTQPDGTLTGERLADLLSLARRLGSTARAEQAERLLADRAIADIVRGELGPGLARTLTFHPAVLRGLLGRLATEPPEVAESVLGGPLGARLSRDDLAGHPELTELWLFQSVTRGDMVPLQAFDEIADMRGRAERSPRADATLLRLLWPRGCPPDQLAELLGFFQAEPATPEVVDWIAVQVSDVAARGPTVGGWLRLAQALAEHPILAGLPEAQARSVRNAARVGPLLEQARQGDADVFASLFAEYGQVDDVTRRLLARTLPGLLLEAAPLGRALRGCPPEVAAIFCARLDSRLAPPQPDIALARRVFGVLARPDMLGHPGFHERLAGCFEQVRKWPRRDLNTLGQLLENDPGMPGPFRAWRDAHRGGLARKILGGAAPPPRPDPPAARPGPPPQRQ